MIYLFCRCGLQSVTIQDFTNLSLNLVKGGSINQCLEMYLKVSDISADSSSSHSTVWGLLVLCLNEFVQVILTCFSLLLCFCRRHTTSLNVSVVPRPPHRNGPSWRCQSKYQRFHFFCLPLWTCDMTLISSLSCLHSVLILQLQRFKYSSIFGLQKKKTSITISPELEVNSEAHTPGEVSTALTL